MMFHSPAAGPVPFIFAALVLTILSIYFVFLSLLINKNYHLKEDRVLWVRIASLPYYGGASSVLLFFFHITYLVSHQEFDSSLRLDRRVSDLEMVWLALTVFFLAFSAFKVSEKFLDQAPVLQPGPIR